MGENDLYVYREDSIQILNAHYTSDGLKMDKEDAVPFSRKIEQAREYWKGNVNNKRSF